MSHHLPDGWIKRYITDITVINKHTIDRSFTHNKIEYIDISSVKEGKLNGKRQYVLSEAPSRAKRVVKHDDVIISTVRPNLRGFYYIDDPIENLIVSTGFTVLSPSNTLSGKYLYYNVVNKEFTRYLTSLAKGASYPAVDSKVIGNWQIPLPPLDIQKKIAHILDKADTLRDQRKQANDKLNDFLQAVFLDLFGDPKSKKAKEHYQPLVNFADIIMGQSPLGESYNIKGEGIPLINGPTEFGEYHPIEKQWTISPTKLSNVDDILFCVRGATAGRLNISDKKYCIGRGVAAIRPKTSKEFIYLTLKLSYEYFQNIGVGSTFINISKEILENLPIPVIKQNEIHTIQKLYNMIKKQKEKNRIATLKLDDLFQSLLQKAFKGELNFNEGYFKELNAVSSRHRPTESRPHVSP